MSKEKILIIDRDTSITELLVCALKNEGYRRVVVVQSGEEALFEIKNNPPDIILLEIELSGINGIDVCKKLKSRPETSEIPVIIVSTRNEESDVFIGLELGADDYITKPFNVKLVIARVRAVLRRYQYATVAKHHNNMLVAGPIRIYTNSRDVFFDGKAVNLTRGEYDMLNFFVKSPNKVFTREQLVLETNRGENITERAIDVQVLGLRRKLGEHAKLLETVRGVGYCLRIS
ncbi:MAG: response regulator transcription factor [Thermoguttaceae bacterium]